MSKSRPSRARLRAAANVVVEYALIALQEEFLLWDKDVNLEVAEFVWNAGGMNLESWVPRPGEPSFSDLVATLCRARRLRWAQEEFLLLNLDSRLDPRPDGEDLLFTFDLSFDDGKRLHACEIAVDLTVAGPTDVN